MELKGVIRVSRGKGVTIPTSFRRMLNETIEFMQWEITNNGLLLKPLRARVVHDFEEMINKTLYYKENGIKLPPLPKPDVVSEEIIDKQLEAEINYVDNAL
jgi:hypothetical protein